MGAGVSPRTKRRLYYFVIATGAGAVLAALYLRDWLSAACAMVALIAITWAEAPRRRDRQRWR